MKFVYSAKTKKGQARMGDVEAQDRESALRELKQRGLLVVSLSPVVKTTGSIFLPVTVLERVVLTKHLAIMLRSGVALDESLRIAELQARGRLRLVLGEVREGVESGQRLADSLGEHPDVFSNYYVNMVRAGEESGNLAENLDQLSSRFAKDYELRRKAQSAMLYPAIVVTLTIALGAIISLYVLPRLSSLFKAFEFELPWSTRVLIAVSQFLAAYGTWVLVALIVVAVGTVIVLRSRPFRPFVHWLALVLPVFRKIGKPVNLARFSMVLASLLKSGLPINVALTVTEQVIGNVHYQRAIKQAGERVDRGESLSSALSGHDWLFPPFVYRMVQIGDETGKTEDVLLYLAEFYENELDLTLKNLSTIIEPVLLVSIGIVVAGVALSIITPIYNFIGAIG